MKTITVSDSTYAELAGIFAGTTTVPPVTPPVPPAGFTLPAHLAGRPVVTSVLPTDSTRVKSQGFSSVAVWRLKFHTPATIPPATDPIRIAGAEWVDQQALRKSMLVRDRDNLVLASRDQPNQLSPTVAYHLAATSSPPRTGQAIAVQPNTDYSVLIWCATDDGQSHNMFMECYL